MTVAARLRVRGAISLIVAPLALGLLSSPSFAKKPRRRGNLEIVACVTNYKSGLDQEKSGHLLEARELFIRCSKSACGSPLREECTTRFTQLSVDIPSVVPVVTSGAGKPVTDVNIQVDGEQLTSTLDGHSFTMNPGPHNFSFSKDGRIFATQSLMIVQGQRNRLIAATLQDGKRTAAAKRSEESATPAVASAAETETADKAEGEAPPAPAVDLAPVASKEAASPSPAGADLSASAHHTFLNSVPKLTLVMAGVAVAGLGTGALLTYWGRKDTTLLNACSPGCPQSSANHIQNLYIASDIAIGVGIAAIAGSYWAYAHSRASHEEGDQGEVAIRSTPAIVLAPTPSGAVGAISGSF